MNDDIFTFLAKSPLAQEIRMTGKVIVRRFTATADEIRNLSPENLEPAVTDGICELEYGGAILARGRIEEKNGERYFVPIPERG